MASAVLGPVQRHRQARSPLLNVPPQAWLEEAALSPARRAEGDGHAAFPASSPSRRCPQGVARIHGSQIQQPGDRGAPSGLRDGRRLGSVPGAIRSVWILCTSCFSDTPRRSPELSGSGVPGMPGINS